LRFQQPRICGEWREREKESNKFDHGFVATLDELNSENIKEKNGKGSLWDSFSGYVRNKPTKNDVSSLGEGKRTEIPFGWLEVGTSGY
jgi:hypothetical protein